jgi:hypothetical protein
MILEENKRCCNCNYWSGQCNKYNWINDALHIASKYQGCGYWSEKEEEGHWKKNGKH